MKQTTLPGTDLSVSRLSFGTASLHHLPTSSQRQQLLATAFDQGFTHFDTAPYYGFGLAESEVGRFVGCHNDQLTVASKVGLHPPGGQASTTAGLWARKALGKLVPVLSKPVVDWSVGAASKSLENSLRRLRRDCVDVLFLHEPDPCLLNTEEFLNWLTRQQDEGKLRYWGLAGPAGRFAKWIQDGHDLAHILQVYDCVEGVQVHPVLTSGRVFQFTYGYLSAARRSNSTVRVDDVLRVALSRNQRGSVLVSTRRVAHVPELAMAIESH